MKSNEWLMNAEFLERVIFHDKYYFQSLCLHISNFVKNVPIPVKTTWDWKYSQIYFSVGKDKKAFKVDVNVAYKDYVFKVEKWLTQFYPQYEVSLTRKVSLNKDEVLEKVNNENMTLEDAQKCEKTIKYKESGIILRAYFKGDPEDTFKIKVNAEQYLMMSGSLHKPYPLSIFFKDFRRVEGDEEKRNFIFENSVKIKDLRPNSNIEELNYLGMQMINFVNIRVDSLKRCSFKKIDTRKWKWKNFILNMETDVLENDILDILRNNEVKIIY